MWMTVKRHFFWQSYVFRLNLGGIIFKLFGNLRPESINSFEELQTIFPHSLQRFPVIKYLGKLTNPSNIEKENVSARLIEESNKVDQ